MKGNDMWVRRARGCRWVLSLHWGLGVACAVGEPKLDHGRTADSSATDGSPGAQPSPDSPTALDLPRFAEPATAGPSLPVSTTLDPEAQTDDSDGDGVPNADDPYDDNDGVLDAADNCPFAINPDPLDSDGDGVGDACDLCLDDPVNDPDGDWICAAGDNCPFAYNPSQADTSEAVFGIAPDGAGDACDDCPLFADGAADADGDGLADECDGCVASGLVVDTDRDNACDDIDNCPGANPDQIDTDSDGSGDACDPDDDNDLVLDDGDGSGEQGDRICPLDVIEDCDDACPLDPNVKFGPNTDGDALADACDSDRDGDEILNFRDNCPDIANPLHTDTDGDHAGDACDSDQDNDTVANQGDVAALDPTRCRDADGDGCDDCSAGFGPMTHNDGPDLDKDGQCDVADPDADGDKVCATAGGLPECHATASDSDDLSRFHCADTDGDTCDDCASGTLDTANDGLDSDGDGICNKGETDCAAVEACSALDGDCDTVPLACDNCPNHTNADQHDHDGDGLGDTCDPCVFSDDNDADNDQRCLIGAQQVAVVATGDSATEPAAAVDEQTEPAIGRTGAVPFVAYLTKSGTVRVLAIEGSPAAFTHREISRVDLVAVFRTSNVGFRASEDRLVFGPRAAVTDEDDYLTYPFGGLKVVPSRVSLASVTRLDDQATHFDCYGGTYGAPGVATLDRWFVASPTPWIMAKVTCPTFSKFAGTSNRRVLLGGGVDTGPASVALGVDARALFDTVLFGDDRAGVAVGNSLSLTLSVHDPFAPSGLKQVTGFTGWLGNLSPSGDAVAVQRRDGTSAPEILYRPQPTRRIHIPFRRLSFTDGPSKAASDTRLVLWSEPSAVRGAHPSSGTRVGFDIEGDTFAARHQVIVRWRPGAIEIWRWFYEDTCPFDAGPEVDTDGDGVGDACDNCPTFATRSSSDLDADGAGDACDLCPVIPGFTPDSDGDGAGDACDPTVAGGDFNCPLLDVELADCGWAIECRDGDHDEPVVCYDPGTGDAPPDFSDDTVVVGPDPTTPGTSFDCGGTIDAAAVVSVFVQAVDATGSPSCDAALPICVTLESRFDFARPLMWIDNCLDATDGAGAVFNHPDGGPRCTQATVTQSGNIFCTMQRVSPVDASLGCLYQVGGPPDTCSVTARTMHPEQRPPFLTSRAGFAACALGDVVMDNTATVTDSAQLLAGHVAAGGDLTMQNQARIEGSVFVGQDIAMRNSALVMGAAFVGGSVTMLNTSAILGTITPRPWPGDICTCGFDLDAAMAFAQTWNNNNRLTDPAIAPHMSNGALVLTHGGQVTLRSGDYFLSGLSLRNRSRLGVEPGGRVRLFVAGAVSMENQTDLNFPLAAGSRLDIVSNFAGAHRLVNNTDSAVRIYAPLASLTLQNSAIMLGSMTASSLLLENTGLLVRPLEAGDDATLALTCQWGE